MADTTPHDTTTPAPGDVLGVLAFSNGWRLELCRSIVIGREPDVTAGAPVRVDDPRVSRNHAVVRVDRWRAHVEDLESRNGTTVAPPGGVPRPLRAGIPFALSEGTRVELAGAIAFVVEPAR